MGMKGKAMNEGGGQIYYLEMVPCGRVPGLATYTGLKVDRVTGLSYLRCVEVGT
jgi:hypothetical protein